MEYAGKQHNTTKSSSQKAQSFFGKKNERAFFAPLCIQPKLTIGPVDDPYEKEADAVADKVMRMSDTQTPQGNSSIINVQRKCSHCDKEEKIQPKITDSFIQKSHADDSVDLNIPNNWDENTLPSPYLKIQLTIPSTDDNAADLVNYGEANMELIQRGKINPSEYTIPYAALWNKNYQLSTKWQLGTITKNLFEKGDALLKPIRELVNKIPLAGGFLSSKVKLDKPDLKGGNWDRHVADKLSLTGLSSALDRDNPSYNAGSGFTFTVNIVDIPFDENNIVGRLFRKPAIHSHNMTAPSIVDHVINSRGQSLDAGTRNFMETRFGHYFGNVQIHNDSEAHRSSAAINALAYTHGRHIVFGAGQYQPNISAGKKLLAHELTHVLQQNSDTIIQRQPSATNPTQASTNVIISLDNDSDTKIQSAVKIKGAKQLRAYSVADLASKLAKLQGKVDNIIIYSHGDRIGFLKFVDSRGRESWVDIDDITKAISGKIKISVDNLELEGCSLGNSSGKLSAFKKAINAVSVKAHSCFTFTRILKRIRINGKIIRKRSDLESKDEPLFRKTLLAEVQKTLVSANGTAVTDCLEGITPHVPLNTTELENVFFANNGVIIAEWDSPVYNKNWQTGSRCKKDVTTSTSPCKLVVAP